MDFNWNRSTQLFLQEYKAIATESEKRFLKYQKFNLDDEQMFEGCEPFTFRAIEVPSVEIHIERSQFDRLVESQHSYLVKKTRHEAELREQYPVLQQLWDQYQMMLALVDEPQEV
jgi:hypothetical protein